MRTIRRAVALSLLLASSAGVGAPAGAAESVRAARVLLVGDSVTQGKAGDYTWRYRLWKTLQEQRKAVDFVGPRQGEFNPVPDPDDLNDVTDYPDPDFDQDHAARWGGSMTFPEYDVRDLVAAYAPDVVINDEGYNDLSVLQQTPEQLIGLMEQFVADVRAVNPAASVVIGQLPQRWVSGVDDYNARLLALSARLDTPGSRVIVALAPVVFTEFEDTYDPAHPTAAGEIKIAGEFAAALAQLALPTVPDPAPAYAGVARLTATGKWRRVRLDFTSPAGATRQEIWMRDRTANGRWKVIASVAAGRRHYRVHPLRRGHHYAFRMRAYELTAPSRLYSNIARARVR